jgi:tetratricopeptide (TPR) repeat protein
VTPHAESAARLERLRGFLAADPGNLALLADAADTALGLGLARDAQAWVERALERAPGDAHFLGRLASAKLALGDAGAAVALLEPLARAHPGEAALQYNYGAALLREARYAEAGEVLGRIADLADAPRGTRALLVRALHYQGKLAEAIEHARRDAEAHPQDAAAAGMVALLCVDAADWTEARRWSSRAQQAGATSLDALLAAGTLALVDEKEDAAEQSFARVLEQRPGNGRALAGLGTVAMLRLDLAAARRHFEAAARDMPSQVPLLNGLAYCQMLAGDFPAAQETLQRAMAVDRTIAETHGASGVLAALQGKWDEAETHARRARGLDPASFGGRLVPVLRMQSAGDGERARRAILDGMKAAPAPGGGTLADMMARLMSRKRD